MNRFTKKQLEEADYRLDEIRDAKVEKEQKLRVPTPRTDEEWAAWPYAGPGISVHFGRELERELTAVTEQRDQWKDKYIQQNKDLGHELRDPNGTIWSECKRLQTELDAVTKQRDEWANLWAELSRSCVKDYVKLERELISITEQRDELLRYNEAFRKETLICADCDAIRKEEYDQAIEQRDRLAEALKAILNDDPDSPRYKIKEAQDALAAWKEARCES
jgi:hypothetical protein